MAPPTKSLRERLRAAQPDPVCVTIVTLEEQARGWLAWISRAKTLEHQVGAYARFHGLLNDYQTHAVLDFDSLAAGEYQQLKQAKLRIGTMDLKIAAMCLSQGALLLTRNLSDFHKVPGLRAEDWTR